MAIASEAFIKVEIVINKWNIFIDLDPVIHNARVILTEVKVTSIINASKDEGSSCRERQKVNIAANKPIKPERLATQRNIEHVEVIGC